MTKAELEKIDLKDFGLPKQRKYPMHDKKHVIKAIQMFKHCPEKDRKELARNIERKAKQYGIKVSKSSLLARYLSDNSPILSEDTQLWQDGGKRIYEPNVSELMEINKEIDQCNKIYLNSDYHLDKIDDINELIKLHNSIVTNNDCFIYLGDIVSDEYNAYLENEGYKFLQKLNGKVKILIRGNNDLLSEEFYLTKCGFHFVVITLKYRNYIFSHAPLNDKSIPVGELNIHGHLHNRTLSDLYAPINHCKIYNKQNNFEPELFDPSMDKFKIQNTIMESLAEYTLFDDCDDIDIFDTNRTIDDSVIHSMRMSLNLEELNLIALNDEDKLNRFNEKVDKLNWLWNMYNSL